LSLGGELVLLKDRDHPYFLQDEANEAGICLCGWFIYDGRLNDIGRLFDDLMVDPSAALKNISDGVFIAAFSHQQQFFVFNDPMGLSNHYYHIVNGALYLAPALRVFELSRLTLEKDPLMAGFLNKRGHLFGVNTVYSGVFRMQPGSILDRQGNQRCYFDLAAVEPIAVEQLPVLMAKLIAYFPAEKRQLPISGGLDSRLILSAGQFALGYCYGPQNSGDRPIARRFAAEFAQFEEFDFSITEKSGNEAAVYQELLETPDAFIKDAFLASYRYASGLRKEATVIFDGFLGDALQPVRRRTVYDDLPNQRAVPCGQRCCRLPR
jgi:asparagine synthetase B (glutamine-hydrolysing)